MVIVSAWYWLAHNQYYPLGKIEIYSGSQHTPQAQITNLLATDVDRSWFKIDLVIIRNKLLQLAWIEKVSLRRLWPDKLVIEITEKPPLAVWNDKAILMANGALFFPQPLSKTPKVLAQLPRFYAAESLKTEVAAKYLEFTEHLLREKLTIERLEVTADRGWTINVNAGFKVFLGKTELTPRLTRFLLAYRAQLRDHRKSISHVDMRYINGLAIGWKTNTTRPIMGNVIK